MDKLEVQLDNELAESPSDTDTGAATDRQPGKIVTVFSAKGGTGKTTISTNLAVTLAAAGTRRVCLVDLDLEFGDVAIALRLTPNRTLVDAVDVNLADEDNVSALITPFSPGLDCVLAPVSPGDAERIPAAVIADLLGQLRLRYDYVVVDTPSQFSEQVLESLDVSDYHLLLTTPEIPSLKNLRLTLDMLDLLGYSSTNRAVVFNRADDRSGLSSADVEAAISGPISARIPVSHDVPASINRGVPITASDPKHPVSLAVRELAQSTITGSPATPERRSGRFGLKLRMRTK